MPAIRSIATALFKKMDIIHLPRAINAGNTICEGEVAIYDYTAPADGFKGRSILHKNALSLVMQGQKTMRFAEATVKANADSIHLLPMGNCVASMDISPLQPFRSIIIFFDDALLRDLFEKNSQLVSDAGTATSPETVPYASFPKDDFIKHFISSLQIIQSNKETLSPRMGLLKFEELMQYLLETYPRQVLSFHRPKSREASEFRIRKIIEANATTDLSLEELAFLCDLSLSTFKRRFQAIYGTTPGSYLLQRRMRAAAALLKDPLQKPGQMFMELGYEDHSSFTRSFSKYHGVSPKEYQRRLLNGYAQFLDNKAKA